MQLKIVNCPDSNFKPYIIEAMQFFAQELIPNTRIRNNCFAKIKFNDKIDEYGYASIEGYNTRKKPRQFLIEIHSGLGARRILETLAHEMVHVKQFIHGETNDQLSKWRGKNINSDKLEYWLHPWEIDAYGREVGLIYKFAVKNALWEIFDEFRDPSTPIVSIPIRWKSL